MPIPNPDSMGDVLWQLNAKAIGDAGTQLILANAQALTSHQNRLQVLSESLLGRMGTTLVQEDPMEAASAKQILTGHSGQDNALVAALAQIMTKAAQTVPPVTSPAPAV